MLRKPLLSIPPNLRIPVNHPSFRRLSTFRIRAKLTMAHALSIMNCNPRNSSISRFLRRAFGNPRAIEFNGAFS